MRKFAALAGALDVSLTACSSISEWGYKMPTGTERFAPVPPEHVELLFAAPSRPFKQIGIVSAIGSVTSSEARFENEAPLDQIAAIDVQTTDLTNMHG
jgi:hypothetical protein